MKTPCTNCGNTVLSLVAAITSGVCLLCVAKMRHSSSTLTVSADAEKWFEKSERSRSYIKGVKHDPYRDEYYWCTNCGKSAAFTAAQQKHAYEVEKRYIFQTRKHCDPCYEARKLGASAS